MHVMHMHMHTHTHLNEAQHLRPDDRITDEVRVKDGLAGGNTLYARTHTSLTKLNT